MKTIIAGSRTITDYKLVKQAVKESGFEITEIVSGRARGIDILGERYAEDHEIPVTVFHAEWSKYGNSAGPRRNQQMVEYADALIAIWDGVSRGTADVISQARRVGLKLFVKKVDS